MSLILSGTDGLSDVDGSAATPAIRGTDANTGIFFGTDIIGFSEGGVEAMRINASGNVVMTGTLTTAAQSIAKASLPTGSVLQVVNGTYSTAASNSTSTYADTGLTASITPSSATSKILVVVHQADPYKSVTNTGSGVNIKLVRGATDIVTFGLANCYTGTAMQNNGTTISTSFLDSPATTSSTTYKTQFANFTNAAAVGLQASGGTSTITLMEIAA